MPSEGFFMAMGGLGVSLAGFAGLIAALDQRPASRSPVAAYRIRGIVFLGFSLTFASFGTLALYPLTGDNLELTVRGGSLLLALPHLRGLRESRPGPLWPDERQRKANIAALLVLLALSAGNVVVGSLGYLQVLTLTALIGPVSIFYNTVRNATGGDTAATEPEAISGDAI
jgi:hypothetical protein